MVHNLSLPTFRSLNTSRFGAQKRQNISNLFRIPIYFKYTRIHICSLKIGRNSIVHSQRQDKDAKLTITEEHS